MMMKKAIEYIKKEIVLCIAVLLAVLSACVIWPDQEYIGYIDFRTLAILFCLMSVMAGLQNLGFFQMIAEKLLCRVKSSSQLVCILVLLCFFFSMLITNDVALITFVPFTFTVLRLLGRQQERRLMVPVVVLQTIAANLGSMLTPVGNPQNLYLYAKSGLSVADFLLLMLPFTLVSLMMLLLCCFLLGQKEKNATLKIGFSEQVSMGGKEKLLTGYLLLFLLCLLTVARIIPILPVLVIVLLAVFSMDRKVLCRVDYSLLLTFVGFFVFIGNMGRIPAFCSFLEKVIRGNEVLTSVLASQVISNVPAALLLSGFTDNYRGLIIGTNLGGLGTLIASMASLISYKYIVKESSERKDIGRYLLLFSAANLIFLLLLAVTYMIERCG